LVAPTSSFNADESSRIECFPFKDISESNCTAAGCIWSLYANGVPSCYLPDSNNYGYQVNSDVEYRPDGSGFSVSLQRLGLPNHPMSLYGGDFDNIVFEVEYETETIMTFVMYPEGSDRFAKRPPIKLNKPKGDISQKLYSVRLLDETIGHPFNFQILRQDTQTVIFDSSMGGLTLAEQFVMISTKLPTKNLYGMGENNHDSFRHNMSYKTWPIFSRDQPPDYEDKNLYGAHPFYMVTENDGSSHGVFFLNSHATDVTTMPHPGLTLRSIGGNLEFIFFLGPTAEEVVQQYTSVIGRTFMPPYWSLGFQISRWGYKNTEEIKAVVNRTRNANIPQDIQYADIDYMDGRRDFTIDPVNFAGLPKLVDRIKDEGVRFVVILDPTIAVDYDVFQRANASNAFVQWENSSVVIGNVWPDAPVAFIDFFKESAKAWWIQEIVDLHDKIHFDAIWIDMNEPSNFDTNIYPDKLQCSLNKWDDPPYETMAAHTGPVKRLSDKTICMNTRLGYDGRYLHYDVHNLYGYIQSVSTKKAAQRATGKRSMVVSRSSFAGSGAHTGHWLGDNFSRWSNLGDSIIGMFEFNMFGIPYNGADICGFIGETTEQMCQRWVELGAFYPFSRSHNDKDSPQQDPATWDSVANAASKALMIRYRLLPYLYTLFYDSHIKGSTVVRPLYHEYPKDSVTWTLHKQFLWGPAFMVTPVLEEDRTTVEAYFPDDVWYDYYTGVRVPSTGRLVLDAPLDHINLHIRGGHILPAQKPALNTMLSRQNNFELIVALKENRASGKMFWDDGETINTIEEGLYQINNFEFNGNQLIISARPGSLNWEGIKPMLYTIQIMGLDFSPKIITVNGTEVHQDAFRYNDATNMLTFKYSFNLNRNWVVNFE